MADTIPKIIGIILAFVLMVVAPMTISRLTDDMAVKRLVLNEVEMFIDKVTDKGSVSRYDVDDLILGVNSYGGAFDVTITRYKRIAIKEGTGDVSTVFVASDDNLTSLIENNNVELQQGDAVQVEVIGLKVTKGSSILRAFFRVDEKPFSFSLAGTVR